MYAESYQRGVERVIEFMGGRDTDVVVPACPDWTALDVLRHLAGDADDVVSLNVDSIASDEWTQAHIDARADLDFDGVVADWRSNAGDAAASLDNIESLGFPPVIDSAFGKVPPSVLPATLIADLLHHEFDLRNAYGDPYGRDLMEIHFAAAGHVKALRSSFAANDLDTIRIESSDSGMGWDIGRDVPVATLRATSFQLMRAIGGRRTKAEMRAMGWDGDPEPYLDSMVLTHLAMRDESLRE
ncbi:MAG: maleylpyruvate isomerase family mycothiol-dependent enzyme [Acidimicrobiia bacterium]